MQLTKGAIGNLVNKYKSVLKKCHLLNVFGTLAVGSLLMVGIAGSAFADNPIKIPGDEGTTTWSKDKPASSDAVIVDGTDVVVSSETLNTNNTVAKLTIQATSKDTKVTVSTGLTVTSGITVGTSEGDTKNAILSVSGAQVTTSGLTVNTSGQVYAANLMVSQGGTLTDGILVGTDGVTSAGLINIDGTVTLASAVELAVTGAITLNSSHSTETDQGLYAKTLSMSTGTLSGTSLLIENGGEYSQTAGTAKITGSDGIEITGSGKLTVNALTLTSGYATSASAGLNAAKLVAGDSAQVLIKGNTTITDAELDVNDLILNNATTSTAAEAGQTVISGSLTQDSGTIKAVSLTIDSTAGFTQNNGIAVITGTDGITIKSSGTLTAQGLTLTGTPETSSEATDAAGVFAVKLDATTAESQIISSSADIVVGEGGSLAAMALIVGSTGGSDGAVVACNAGLSQSGGTILVGTQTSDTSKLTIAGGKSLTQTGGVINVLGTDGVDVSSGSISVTALTLSSTVSSNGTTEGLNAQRITFNSGDGIGLVGTADSSGKYTFGEIDIQAGTEGSKALSAVSLTLTAESASTPTDAGVYAQKLTISADGGAVALNSGGTNALGKITVSTGGEIESAGSLNLSKNVTSANATSAGTLYGSEFLQNSDGKAAFASIVMESGTELTATSLTINSSGTASDAGVYTKSLTQASTGKISVISSEDESTLGAVTVDSSGNLVISGATLVTAVSDSGSSGLNAQSLDIKAGGKVIVAGYSASSDATGSGTVALAGAVTLGSGGELTLDSAGTLAVLSKSNDGTVSVDKKSSLNATQINLGSYTTAGAVTGTGLYTAKLNVGASDVAYVNITDPANEDFSPVSGVKTAFSNGGQVSVDGGSYVNLGTLSGVDTWQATTSSSANIITVASGTLYLENLSIAADKLHPSTVADGIVLKTTGKIQIADTLTITSGSKIAAVGDIQAKKLVADGLELTSNAQSITLLGEGSDKDFLTAESFVSNGVLNLGDGTEDTNGGKTSAALTVASDMSVQGNGSETTWTFGELTQTAGTITASSDVVLTIESFDSSAGGVLSLEGAQATVSDTFVTKDATSVDLVSGAALTINYDQAVASVAEDNTVTLQSTIFMMDVDGQSTVTLAGKYEALSIQAAANLKGLLINGDGKLDVEINEKSTTGEESLSDVEGLEIPNTDVTASSDAVGTTTVAGVTADSEAGVAGAEVKADNTLTLTGAKDGILTGETAEGAQDGTVTLNSGSGLVVGSEGASTEASLKGDVTGNAGAQTLTAAGGTNTIEGKVDLGAGEDEINVNEGTLNVGGSISASEGTLTVSDGATLTAGSDIKVATLTANGGTVTAGSDIAVETLSAESGSVTSESGAITTATDGGINAAGGTVAASGAITAGTDGIVAQKLTSESDNIESAGNLEVTADSAGAGAFTAGGTDASTVAGNLTLENVNNGEESASDIAGGLTVAGNAALTDAAITSSSGDITLNTDADTATTAAGDVTLSATGEGKGVSTKALTVGDDTGTESALSITANSDAKVDGALEVKAGTTSAEITSTAGNVEVAGALTAESGTSVKLIADGEGATVAVSDAINADSGSNVSLSATGEGGAVAASSDVSAETNSTLAMTADSAVTLSSGLTAESGAAVTLTANDEAGTVGVANAIDAKAGSEVTLSASGASGTVTASDAVNVGSGSELTMTAGSAVTVTGALTVDSAATADSGATVKLEATGESGTVTASKAVTAGANRNITMTAPSGVTVEGALTADTGAAVTLQANGDTGTVALKNAVNAEQGSSVTVEATGTSGAITAASALTAGSGATVSMTAGSDVTVSTGGIIADSGAEITLSGGNDVSVTGDVTLQSGSTLAVTATGGDITLTPEGETAIAGTNAESVSLQATSGNVTLGTGAVTMTGGGDLTIAAAQGDTSGEAGTITLGGITAESSAVTLTGTQLTATSDVSVGEGSTITLTGEDTRASEITGNLTTAKNTQANVGDLAVTGAADLTGTTLNGTNLTLGSDGVASSSVFGTKSTVSVDNLTLLGSDEDTGTVDLTIGSTSTSDGTTVTVSDTFDTGSADIAVLNSVLNIGTFSGSDGMFFIDPAYVSIDAVEGDFGKFLAVGNGSVVEIGTSEDDADKITAAIQSYDITINANKTVSNGSSVLILGEAVTLGTNGKIVLDADITSGADAVTQYGAGSDTTSYKAYFASNSLLVVSGEAAKNSAGAINVSSDGWKAGVEDGAKLYIYNAEANTTYTIVGDGFDTSEALGTDGTTASATKTGWTGDNFLTDSLLIGADAASFNDDGTITITTKSVSAGSVFPGLDSELVGMINSGVAANQIGPNNVNASNYGQRYLSRAVDDRYIGSTDSRGAVKAIESAARIALLSGAPIMTFMANEAAANAVTSRTSIANPANSILGMNADGSAQAGGATGDGYGKNGFGMWVMPLYQAYNGYGLEGGNLDLDVNGRIGGVALGADYTWDNTFRAGLTFNIGGGYAEGSGDFKSTDNNMNFWGIGAYFGWAQGISESDVFSLTGDINYTQTFNAVEQSVDGRLSPDGSFSKLKSDIESYALSVGLRADYKIVMDAVDITPHVGVRYTHLHTNEYNVKSNGHKILKGDEINQDIWSFPIGVTFSKDFALNDEWYVRPSLDLQVVPHAGDVKARGDVRFTGVGSKAEVETQMMDYFTYGGQLGVEFGNDTIKLGVNYNIQHGANSTSHGVFGTFRVEF